MAGLCEHQLLCSLVEERRSGQPRLNSQSDDLSSSPAQPLSGLQPLPDVGEDQAVPGLHANTSPPSISSPRNWALSHARELHSASQLSRGHRRLCALLALWGQVGTTEA